MTSPLWRHPVMWHHPQHAQLIAHMQVPIGCTLKQSRYLASFRRYLAPKLRQWLYLMTSSVTVIRPGSTIRDDHIDTPYSGALCSSIVQFWQELPEKKHFKEKSVTLPLWRHPVTWRHSEYAQSIAHRQVPIGCTLKPSRCIWRRFRDI